MDTTVISHLEQAEKPKEMLASRVFWEQAKFGFYHLCLSHVTQDEIMACPQPRLDQLIVWMSQVIIDVLQACPEVEALAEAYVDSGRLRRRHLADRRHIAYATVYGCDAIVSWNFEHIANELTRIAVNAVNAKAGYSSIVICSPDIL